MAFGGVLIDAGVGPFAQRSLDETLGFAVGARGVGARAQVTDAEFAASGGEQTGVVAGSIIGQHAADGDPQACVVGDRFTEKSYGSRGPLVGMKRAEGDAGMVIDGDVQQFPTGAASFIVGIAGEAMARFDDAREFFGVEVQQVARMRVFIANHRHGGLQLAGAAEFMTAQNAADGGGTEARGLCNAHRGPTLATQREHQFALFGAGAARRMLRARTGVVQSRLAVELIAAHPLGGGLDADAEGGSCRLPRHALQEDEVD